MFRELDRDDAAQFVQALADCGLLSDEGRTSKSILMSAVAEVKTSQRGAIGRNPERLGGILPPGVESLANAWLKAGYISEKGRLLSLLGHTPSKRPAEPGAHPLSDLLLHGQHPFPEDLEAPARMLCQLLPAEVQALDGMPNTWQAWAAGQHVTEGTSLLAQLLEHRSDVAARRRHRENYLAAVTRKSGSGSGSRSPAPAAPDPARLNPAPAAHLEGVRRTLVSLMLGFCATLLVSPAVRVASDAFGDRSELAGLVLLLLLPLACIAAYWILGRMPVYRRRGRASAPLR